MKAILFVAVVLAFAAAFPSFEGKMEEPVKFDVDLFEDSPISFAMKGQVNPINEQQNKIETFVRLAGEYIPILETLAEKEGSLTWQRWWDVNVLGINIRVEFYFQLIVGWRVQPGSTIAGRFDVVYTPFAEGVTWARTNGTTWPAIGSAEAILHYVNFTAPIAFTLSNTGRVCFGGGYYLAPVTFYQNIFLSLRQCRDEILNDIIYNQPLFVWDCDLVAPVNATLFDLHLYEGFSGNLLAETCIDF